MKNYIRKIILINSKNNEIREVPLSEGINIITGDSKTGKSALVEIIDYCYCSTQSTIPKGTITEFTDIYCIVLSVEDSDYIIARNYQDGKCILKS